MVLTWLVAAAAAAELPLPAPPSVPSVGTPRTDAIILHLSATTGLMFRVAGPAEVSGFVAPTSRIELGAGRGRLRLTGVSELEMIRVTPWWDTDVAETGGLLEDTIVWQLGPAARYLLTTRGVWVSARLEGGVVVLVTPMEPEAYAEDVAREFEDPPPLSRLGPWNAVGLDVGYPVLGGAVVIEVSTDVSYVFAVGLQIQQRVGATARL